MCVRQSEDVRRLRIARKIRLLLWQSGVQSETCPRPLGAILFVSFILCYACYLRQLNARLLLIIHLVMPQLRACIVIDSELIRTVTCVPMFDEFASLILIVLHVPIHLEVY